MPQAIRLVWPMITPGTPAKVKPATSKGQACDSVWQCRPIWYQMPGRLGARCGSLASSGLPVEVSRRTTTQELEPTPSHRRHEVRDGVERGLRGIEAALRAGRAERREQLARPGATHRPGRCGLRRRSKDRRGSRWAVRGSKLAEGVGLAAPVPASG